MGITGTDVSKEAADMVLRDDNFATIVAAVEEGRVIYDNLRRFVSFAVAGNLGKIIVMLGWPIPFLISDSDAGTAIAFLPLQLLWLNLMTDGLLGLSMGVEPAEKNVMQRPPAFAVGQSVGERPRGPDGVDRHGDRRGDPRHSGSRYYAADVGAVADHDVHDVGVHAGRPGVRHPIDDRVAAHDRLADEPADALDRAAS